jgi:hypothetical protein
MEKEVSDALAKELKERENSIKSSYRQQLKHIRKLKASLECRKKER